MKSRHNPPPETPRERMWERIAEARGQRRTRRRMPPPVRLWTYAAAMAAVLVLGVAIGRWSGSGGLPATDAPDPMQQTVAQMGEQMGETEAGTGRTEATPNLLYTKAAADLFDRADVLLTGFKVTPCAEQDLQAVPDWAGSMLLQTRLLLNTPVAGDPALRDLLLDLELVLAQIAGLNRDNCARDAAWIRDALDQQATIDRLRLLRPRGAAHKVI